jgi:glycosyltransferase involved in cell wall biosynthesis
MTHIVTIDARMLGATGIGTYLEELLAGFTATDHEFRFKVVCPGPDRIGSREIEQNGITAEAQRLRDEHNKNGAAPSMFSEAASRPERFEFIRARASIYSLREHWEIARLARGADLLHCPHYNIPYFYKGRMLVTIHDLTHLVDRDFVPNRLAYYYARIMLRAAAHHARQVITVSEFSKRSICQALEVPENKVHVISYGVPRRILQSGPVNMALLEKLEVSQPYILFVGLLKPHKNVQALLRAFALLPEQVRASHQLVIAGKLDTCYPALRQLSQDLRLSDRVVFTGYVTDEELRALYAGAKVFVLPSLNEGYGLPVLEAMAYGVPVVVSNISSLPEVVGDAGILIDPRDDQSIAKALEGLLFDDELRKTLGERGRKRAHSFSTKEFALKHLEVYRMALAG